MVLVDVEDRTWTLFSKLMLSQSETGSWPVLANKWRGGIRFILIIDVWWHSILLSCCQERVVTTIIVESLEDCCGCDRCTWNMTDSTTNILTPIKNRVLPLSSDETLVLGLVATSHKVLDPVVLKTIAIWIEAIRISDNFYLTVVVWCSTIGGNNSPLKVGMLEVGTIIVLEQGLVLSL